MAFFSAAKSQPPCIFPVPSKKTNLTAPFKETSLKEHPIPFRDDAREWYNGKSIEHLHLYAYEGASRHHHTLCQLVDVCDKPWH